jgi:fused signal recognition particle receptor
MSKDDASGGRGLFARLRSGLARTRAVLTTDVADLLRGRTAIDDDLLDELETILLAADVGVDACQRLLGELRERVRRKQAGDAEAVLGALRQGMLDILLPVSAPLAIPPRSTSPFMILMVGVNGAGKTTTIGKLAARLKSEGHSVMLAAGDTFRAAAVEQLQRWGDRNDVPVVAQQPGADPASVVYDALESARARKMDVLIADTAGRLHTQGGLMEELKKIKRVAAKLDAEAPHETLLVIDAGMGQNSLVQARQFHEAVGLTGVVLTKLDGTARGGVVLAMAQQLGVPLRLVGVGEGPDDLRDFDAQEFVKALLDA